MDKPKELKKVKKLEKCEDCSSEKATKSTDKPKKKPSEYNLYVKKHYQRVKNAGGGTLKPSQIISALAYEYKYAKRKD